MWGDLVDMAAMPLKMATENAVQAMKAMEAICRTIGAAQVLINSGIIRDVEQLTKFALACGMPSSYTEAFKGSVVVLNVFGEPEDEEKDGE